jgi:hypothetical protein
MAGVVSPLVDLEGASQRVKGERDVDAARLAIVHVASHSRQRHKVMTVIVLASVSTRLPWQNGHAVGLLTASFNRDSDIVGVFDLAFIKRFALFTNAHESELLRPRASAKYFPNSLRHGLRRCTPAPHEHRARQ